MKFDLDSNPEIKKELISRELAALDRDYQIEKFKLRKVDDWAKQNYPSQHRPTLNMLRRAIKLNGHGREYNILITGPSGTGKEIVAKIIGYDNYTDYAPKIKSINMAGLTDTLFESQLFGYVGGSFTGALSKGTPGFLRSVGKGTAFLDEIGELPLSQQAKLLRVLQDREILPVGGVDSVKIDCRFIFATNRNLLDMVKAGTFRKDLYFRISQIELQTYSLAERGPEEVRLIASSIIKDMAWTELAPEEALPSPEFFQLGNVRALFKYLLTRELHIS